VEAMKSVNIVSKDSTKIQLVITRVLNAPKVTTTKQKVRQHAMLSLLVPIIGIQKYEPVILDIIVPV
jgi:hypothetical protein